MTILSSQSWVNVSGGLLLILIVLAALESGVHLNHSGNLVGASRGEVSDHRSQGRLKQPMRGSDLNKALGITRGGNFLAQHCLGTGSSTARFVRVSRGLYRLKDSA